MYLTGFADEAAAGIDGQIRATKELGWSHIEARNVDGANLHDLSEAAFAAACDRLGEAGVRVNCFGSAIANWQRGVEEPFDVTLAQVARAIPRMQKLESRLIRIMSYRVMDDRAPEDQEEEERFRRLREIVGRFLDAGIQPVHENCMNYGGMGYPYTLKLLENVPGLKLVFDTGNPVFSADRTGPPPWPMQCAWEFYEHVKEHVAYLHIKDGIRHEDSGKMEYTYPGEGDGCVRRILADLLERGYDGGISIEPHMADVFHDRTVTSSEEIKARTYVEYGRRLMALLEETGHPCHG